MMAYKFSSRSESRLAGINADLARLARVALSLSTVDFAVTEGLRTKERQRELVDAGKSQTMKSRHITGHAIDVYAYPAGEASGSWDWRYYEQIAKAFRLASLQTGIPVEWGGEWRTLKDGPHFQLPVAKYPG
ncbi:M15 family peptidase [Salmonella enterica subsp. enterica serovar Nigeria]|nr:M15 family peptidase [Salmonella enterica subsp. enterica serovar Nigeria]